jgi:hypothetical protein
MAKLSRMHSLLKSDSLPFIKLGRQIYEYATLKDEFLKPESGRSPEFNLNYEKHLVRYNQISANFKRLQRIVNEDDLDKKVKELQAKIDLIDGIKSVTGGGALVVNEMTRLEAGIITMKTLIVFRSRIGKLNSLDYYTDHEDELLAMLDWS